jgi:hypothetical protein
VVPGPDYPPGPTLPDWVPPTQGQNPSRQDVNAVGSTLQERILSISPWGTYVPVIYGTDFIGPIITLIHTSHPYFYMRLVWCVGEIESIEEVFIPGQSNPPGTQFTHYTGTSAQGVDGTLAAAIPGYSDTLTDVGVSGQDLAYTVVRIPSTTLETFPRFVAKIKGLKVPSAVPTIESVVPGAGGGSGDTVTLSGNTVTATDKSLNGQVVPFIRYYEDELIDNESYTFEITVTEYNNQGAGTANVTWADETLLDGDSNPVIITGPGTYIGSATRATYDGTYNHLKMIVNGNAGVQLVYSVKAYNTLGNAVTKYHENAGVCLNHLITDTTQGLGLTSNFASLVDLIHRNNEVLSTTGFEELRSVIGLSLTRKRPIVDSIETMRGYARTRVINVNGEVKYIPLQPKAVSFTITNSDIKGRPRFKKKDIRDIPNIARVYYTDEFQDDVRDNFVQVSTSEVDAGSEPRREAVYRMPGFRSKPSALRYATETINQRLRLFGITFRTHQSIYQWDEGDTFTLNIDELNNVDQKMIIVYKKKINLTEYEVYAEFEDDNIYSDEIADYEPDATNLLSDDPFDVTDATGLTLAVEADQFQTAIYMSRVRVTWTATVYPYLHQYKVALYDNSDDTLIENKVLDRNVTETTFNNIQEGVTYRVELQVLAYGNLSTGVTDTITPTGKDFPPTDVPTFLASQDKGIVSCTWEPAADNQAVWYYEIQFGPAGFAWNDINARLFVSRIDAYSFIGGGVPAGTWDFLIKAVDNAGNQSTNATRFSGLVVQDYPDYHPVDYDTIAIDESATTGMTAFLSDRVGSPSQYDATYFTIKDWATDTGDTWATMHPNAMNTYTTDPYLTEGSGTAGSTLYTESVNIGQEIDGVYEIVNTVSDAEILAYYIVSGGNMLESLEGDYPNACIQLSDDNSTWTDHPGFSASGTARYMRLKIQSPDTASRWIWRYGSYFYRIRAKIQTEYESFTWSTVNNSFSFARNTRDLQFAMVSVAQSGDYTVTWSPVQSGFNISGIAIEVYDSTGSLASGDIDLNIIVRYI